MSAPTSRHSSQERDRMNLHPKWINPCGSGATDEIETDLDLPHLNVDELLTSIVVAAKNTLMHAERFKDEY
ncbi:hypothetical protein L9F63_024695, partial [Diploptera punctata]